MIYCLKLIFLQINKGNFSFFKSEVRDNLKRKYKISDEDYKMVEVIIIESKPHKAGPQWKFTGAFYFATVVLAMIGNKLLKLFIIIKL